MKAFIVDRYKSNSALRLGETCQRKFLMPARCNALRNDLVST